MSESTALAARPSTTVNVYDKVANLVEYVTEMSESIAVVLGCDLRAGKALAVMLLRRNMDVMDFLQQYHFIQGRPVMRSDAMLANFVTLGGKHRVIESSPEIAHVELTDPDGHVTTWKTTWADAQQEAWPWKSGGKPGDTPTKTNLKDNWATPIGRENMLWWRTVSRACHRVAPGLVAGLTPDDADYPIGDTVSAAPAADNRQTAAQIEAARKAAMEQAGEIDGEFEVDDSMAANPEEPTPVAPFESNDDVQPGDGTVTKEQREAIDAGFARLFAGDELQAVRAATLKQRGVNSFRSLSTEQAKEILSRLSAKIREIDSAKK